MVKPLPTYGDLIPLDTFIRLVESGRFIDYDGIGYYATAAEISNKPAIPSEIEAGMIDAAFSHVMWFNR